MEITKAAVVGCGVMGTGIAQQIAMSGIPVIFYGRNLERAITAAERIEATLTARVRKGKMREEEMYAALYRIHVTDAIEETADAGIVVEAIAEDLDQKQRIFRKLDGLCGEETVLATNTSALSVTRIAGAVRVPGRVIGTHFFNPVPAMKLTEIVMGRDTSEETYEAARAFCERIGKTCVRLNCDTPGFIVNRVLFAYFLECVHIYEEGIASKEDIDTAIRLGLNHPLGPFRLMDLGGLDTFPSVCESLQEISRERFRCPESVLELREEGKFGTKTGEGWYQYGE